MVTTPSTIPSLPPHSAGEYFRIDGETLERRLGREGRLAPVTVASLGIALIDSGHGALPPAQVFVARSGETEIVKPLGARPPGGLECPRQVYALATLLRRCSGDGEVDPSLDAVLVKAEALELDLTELRAALVACRAEGLRVEGLLADFLGVDRTRATPVPPRRASDHALPFRPTSLPPPPHVAPPPPPPSLPSLRLNLQSIAPLVVLGNDA